MAEDIHIGDANDGLWYHDVRGSKLQGISNDTSSDCPRTPTFLNTMSNPPNFPLLMAHRGGFGTENSLQAIKSSTHCDIVELDIRKSQEGILYCYHGNLIEFLFPRLFFHQPFLKLKQKYPTLITLQKAAKAINNRILFLDIKDTTISIEELQQVLPANINSVYLACQNID